MSVKAASVQGRAGDKSFKQRLSEITEADTFFLVSPQLTSSKLAGKKKNL